MLLFVYGTLRRGGRLNGYLEKSAYLGEARTTFSEFDLIGSHSFPFLTTRGKYFVVGDVFDIDRELLDVLDRVEGVPHLYERHKISVNVRSAKGRPEWAWAYLSSNKHTESLVNIEYREHSNEKEWINAN